MKYLPGTLFVLVMGAVVTAVLNRFGWIDLSLIISLALHIVGFLAVIALIKLPWDLYFEARGLIDDQEASERRGKSVTPQDRGEARVLLRRLLLLCLSLHFGLAAVLAVATAVLDGSYGYYYAAAFALSAACRPLTAYYRYQMGRLRRLRGELNFPRDDIQALKNRLAQLESVAPHTARQAEQLERQLGQLQQSTDERVTKAEAAARKQALDYDEKVDRVCREFSRSIEQLTDDKVLLGGLKAFVRMVKNA